MTHYHMPLSEVRQLPVADAKQLLHWAQAMQGQEEVAANAVYLGYDSVPPMEGD